MHLKFSIVLVITLLLSLTSCRNTPDNEQVEHLYFSWYLRSGCAPDKRVAIYDINLSTVADQVIINGETDQKKALTTLVEILKNQGKSIENLVVLSVTVGAGN